MGIGYFWKAISGKDLITGDILSEAERKSAAWCGTTELAVSLISAALASTGVGSFAALLLAEGLSGSIAAMTYESAVISGMSETEAAILALLTGMTSGCALDDIISNSDTTMTKLGNQLGKSSDEMADIMGGLKKLAAKNDFSSVDEMLDAALNNPSRLPAGLHDDIIEAIDGPMGGFNLPKNVDVDVPSVAYDSSAIKDNLVSEINNIRSKMPNTNLAKRGNMAIAEVEIPGVKENYVAHSKINGVLDKGSDVAEFSYLKPEEDRIFTSYVDDKFPRYHDTEAKILEDIASAITDPNVKGTINLYSELPCCQSCSNIILEFRKMYPNIELNILVE